jgi:hypothetical protein
MGLVAFAISLLYVVYQEILAQHIVTGFFCFSISLSNMEQPFLFDRCCVFLVPSEVEVLSRLFPGSQSVKDLMLTERALLITV